MSNDKIVPLIVLDRPPISEESYLQLYEDYRKVRDRRDKMIGGELGRFEILQGNLQFTRNSQVHEKSELLTPYRSWWKQQHLVSDLLMKLPLRKAIFLFEPNRHELYLINPLPMSRISDRGSRQRKNDGSRSDVRRVAKTSSRRSWSADSLLQRRRT